MHTNIVMMVILMSLLSAFFTPHERANVSIMQSNGIKYSDVLWTLIYLSPKSFHSVEQDRMGKFGDKY